MDSKSDRWIEELRTKPWLNPEFIDWIGRYMKGIRVGTLKNFLLFTYFARRRFRELGEIEENGKTGWKKWKERSPKKRGHLRYDFLNYLEIDGVEIEYYVRMLGWSKRLVIDYLLALRQLLLLL